MPGYPTKKLLFGGPDTRTNAAMVFAKSQRELHTMRYAIVSGRQDRYVGHPGGAQAIAGLAAQGCVCVKGVEGGVGTVGERAALV